MQENRYLAKHNVTLIASIGIAIGFSTATHYHFSGIRESG